MELNNPNHNIRPLPGTADRRHLETLLSETQQKMERSQRKLGESEMIKTLGKLIADTGKDLGLSVAYLNKINDHQDAQVRRDIAFCEGLMVELRADLAALNNQ